MGVWTGMWLGGSPRWECHVPEDGARPQVREEPERMQELIGRLLSEQELSARLAWFIRLRWVFLLGLSLSIGLSSLLLRIALPYRQILLVAGIIFAYNTAFYLHHAFFTRNRTPEVTGARIEANVQIGADILALTAMIHFS